MKKTALITGITGQDGSFLAELLLGLGYEVHGIVRRVAIEDPLRRFSRIRHLLDDITLHPASLESYASLFSVVSKVRFDECYHLASQSFVAESFSDGFSTMSTNINGTHFVLEALRQANPDCRFYFAGTSEMFGSAQEVPQREGTPFHPRSPYGISKVAGYYLTINYREAYGMFSVNGILFNHESPRRGETFVSRKISMAAARIAAGEQQHLYLGNLDARRDWGYAKEYVEAMWLMLQADEPADYVVATGTAYSVRDFLGFAFGHVGLDWEKYVRFDERYLRPTEVDELVGDPSKVQEKLGWKAQTMVPELARLMVDADMELLR